MATNLRHQFFALQAVVPMMREAAGGSAIINFGSISWHTNHGDMPAYTTAQKAKPRDRGGLTKGMARDLGAYKILRQHGHSGLGDDAAPDRFVADAGGGIEFAERAMPEGEGGTLQISRAWCLWLASDDSRMYTWRQDVGGGRRPVIELDRLAAGPIRRPKTSNLTGTTLGRGTSPDIWRRLPTHRSLSRSMAPGRDR